MRDKIDELIRNSGAKIQQMKSRKESELRGTRGRKEHKAKAQSTNKHKGGKMAR
jgi:hypothetical protein